jgi:hypothetical protein
VNDPTQRVHTTSTLPCTNYRWYSASHYRGVGPELGAEANGGSYYAPYGSFSASCQQLAHASSASQTLAVTRPVLVGTEAIDPAFAKRCPGGTDFGVQVDISARAQSRLRANLHLQFFKFFQQYNPIGGFFRSPWRGVASGVVEAFVDDSWRKAIASGQIMVGSNCQVTASGGFSATVGSGQGGTTVGPSAGVWSSCATESWPMADLPRDQPLDAHVQNSSKTLRMTVSPPPTDPAQSQSLSAGYKASDFKAEAWSASPAEATPLLEVWAMRSTSRASVTGGCMELAYESCHIAQTAGAGIACRLGEPTRAVYTAGAGVTCLSIP